MDEGIFVEVEEGYWTKAVETYGINHEKYDVDLKHLGKEFPQFKITLTTYQWYLHDAYDRYMYTRLIYIKPRGKTEKRVYICHSDDEWYYVSAGEGKGVKYWKCDQMHGLVEFLKSFFRLELERLR
jgi:hypothetical protein